MAMFAKILAVLFIASASAVTTPGLAQASGTNAELLHTDASGNTAPAFNRAGMSSVGSDGAFELRAEDAPRPANNTNAPTVAPKLNAVLIYSSVDTSRIQLLTFSPTGLGKNNMIQYITQNLSGSASYDWYVVNTSQAVDSAITQTVSTGGSVYDLYPH